MVGSRQTSVEKEVDLAGCLVRGFLLAEMGEPSIGEWDSEDESSLFKLVCCAGE